MMCVAHQPPRVAALPSPRLLTPTSPPPPPLLQPEHPLSLEQLNVASLDLISVDDAASTVDVRFTPTIPHCSMATLIGLCIRVKLLRALPPRFKTRVSITAGTHSLEDSINKQLADKERVAAALENGTLAGVIAQCFANSDRL